MSLEYNDKTYASIAAFAKDNNLRYATTVAQLNKGLTPQQVIDRQKFRKNTTSGGTSCSYNGVVYSSLLEAAQNLDINPSYLYALCRKKNLSPDEAIEKVMEGKQAITRSGNRKTCIVDGVEYDSVTSALKAYNVSSVTVRSRMRRENITLEQAIMQGSKEHRRLKPTQMVFRPSKFVKTENFDVSVLPKTYQQLIDRIAFIGYQLEFYTHKDNPEIFAIKINESFCLNKYKASCWIIITPNTIEMIIPDLITGDCFDIVNENLIGFLNKANGTFCGIKVWQPTDRKNILYVGFNLTRPKVNEINVQTVVAMLLALLGSTEQLMNTIR